MNKKLVLNTLSLLMLSLAPGLAHADDVPATASDHPTYEITTVKATSGAQMSWGSCPCFRWTMQVDVGSGHIETRTFDISSKALFSFRDEVTSDFLQSTMKLYTVGAIEALWKGGHIGIGTTGFTWGDDEDNGYTNVMKSGVYFLVSLIRNGSLNWNIHSGDQFESMRVNEGPTITRNQLVESTTFSWATTSTEGKKGKGRWSGYIDGHIGLDTSHMLDSTYLEGGGGLGVHARIFKFHDLEVGAGFGALFEYDGWRNYMGLTPASVTGALTLDVKYVESNE